MVEIPERNMQTPGQLILKLLLVSQWVHLTTCN